MTPISKPPWLGRMLPPRPPTKGKGAQAVAVNHAKITLQVTAKGVPRVVSGDDTVDYGRVVEVVDAARNAGLNLVALGSD